MEGFDAISPALFIISVSIFFFSQIKKSVLDIKGADEAEKKTFPFLNLIPDIKVEICSFLSPRDKFQLWKFICLEGKENDEQLLLGHLYSGVRTDDDIHAAVNAWCADPRAAEIEYGHISLWDTSKVTNMRHLFRDKRYFNDDISLWNVGNVTNMHGMFYYAFAFNQPLGQWNVGKVTNMHDMFCCASAFNQPLGQWNVGNVTTMEGMFCDASAFNQPLGQWNVGKVTDMKYMFASSGMSNGNKPQRRR
jgi:surface protein